MVTKDFCRLLQKLDASCLRPEGHRANNSKPEQNMSTYTVTEENIPTTAEREAITSFQVISDQANVTRSQAARILRQVPGIGYIHIGGRHVSINRDNCRVAVITSNHPDWN